MTQLRCVLHGSFRKHWSEIKRVHEVFTRAGIQVVAPVLSEIKTIKDGFAVLESDQEADQRMTELLYLHHLKELGYGGFSYFVNPEGYIGKSASYELGIAQVSNVPCFFMERLVDHPAYTHKASVWMPEVLAAYVQGHQALPRPKVKRNERVIHRLWEELMVPGSVVAVGGIIEYAGAGAKKEKEVLLVKTHKWGGRYCIVGGRVRRNERLRDALVREVREETGLRAKVGNHICTFDQIKNSGYYRPGIQHIFVDKVVKADSRRVTLNHEAQEHLWVPPQVALDELDIEPNARHTLELYTKALIRN